MNRYGILLGKKSEKKNNSYLRWQRGSDFKEPKLYRQEPLGVFVVPTCSVSGSDGSRCPGKPEYSLKIMGKYVDLCERCYDNYRKGYFNSRRQKDEKGHEITSCPM